MIKVFRKIRQQLLKEGKTTQYIKYAIGEIALVVIGILIALQINNWNEQRLEEIEINNILNTITSNLNSDINALDNEITDGTKFMTIMGEASFW